MPGEVEMKDAAEPGPNQTIYVNNINEKIKKDDLKKAMYCMFSQFGPILDVVASKTVTMRGQAFIVFGDVTHAATALRSMQGFPFYDKQLRISFAKSKSDAAAKADGTWVEGEKEAKKRKEQAAARRAEHKKLKAAIPGAIPEGHGKVEEPAPGKANLAAAAPATTQQPPAAPTAPAPPNKVLFLENLPNECTDMMLSMLFQQFPGYKEVRLVPTKPGIGFVEFENEGQAAVALSGLQGFKITEKNLMRISFAKK